MGKKNKKFLDILRRVAPTVATALGGPLAGTAVQALSNAVLGKPDGTEADIEAVVAADPDALLKLKTAEYEFKERMKELEISEDELVYKDMDSARKRHMTVGDGEPARLAYLAMLVFAILVGIVITRADVFVDNQFATVIVSTIIGASIGWVDKAYNFFLGSSRGSKDKTAALVDAIKDQANK